MLLVAGAFLVAGCGEDEPDEPHEPDELAVGVGEVCDLYEDERDRDGIALQRQLDEDHDERVAALVVAACGPAAAAAVDRQRERAAEAEREERIAEAAEEQARQAEEEERQKRDEERQERAAERERERQATAWVPSGFRQLSDDLAVRQIGGVACRTSARCLHYEVVARSGCSRIYVEGNILDADQRVIGWTNDTLGSLPAEQVGVLEFTTRESQAAQFQITQARCHR